MKKITKIVLIVLNALIVLSAIITLAYYLGWKKIENKLIMQGFNTAVGQIVNTIDQVGQVQITKDLILIKKQ